MTTKNLISQPEGDRKIFGFWIFLSAEVVLFSCLFGTYLALKHHTDGGPTPNELFELKETIKSTVVLLTSSFTSAMAIKNMQQEKLVPTQIWFSITVLLGLVFLGLEIKEFMRYVHEGLGLGRSAFASAYYLLLGTHGSHVLFGTVWISTLIFQAGRQGITVGTAPKLFVASLYWHFVDVVWVFIFTVVYLLGKVG